MDITGQYDVYLRTDLIPVEQFANAISALWSLKNTQHNVLGYSVTVQDVFFDTASTDVVLRLEITTAGSGNVQEAGMETVVYAIIAVVGLTAAIILIDKIVKLTGILSKPAVELGGFKISQIAMVAIVIILILIYK